MNILTQNTECARSHHQSWQSPHPCWSHVDIESTQHRSLTSLLLMLLLLLRLLVELRQRPIVSGCHGHYTCWQPHEDVINETVSPACQLISLWQWGPSTLTQFAYSCYMFKMSTTGWHTCCSHLRWSFTALSMAFSSNADQINWSAF